MDNNENPDITGKKQGKWFPPVDHQWKKGESGNPAGRPPGSISITAEIKKKLLEIPENQQKTILDLLVNKIIRKAAVDGDDQMIKQIWSYIDGPPRPAENPEPAPSIMQVNLLNKEDIKVREESNVKVLA